MKVFISTSSFGKADTAPLRKCESRCEVKLNPYGRKLTTEEFIELTEDADGVIAGVEEITREALMKRPNIKVISRCGAGMDSVDQKACRELGVRLYNTPNAPVDSVSELTVTLMLDLLKNVSNMNAALKAGNWNKMTGFMLKGKNVGIIGFGRIGRRVAGLLEPFGVETAYSDVCNLHNGYTFMEKEKLLAWADIVTIHASGSETGACIIGAKELRTMKNTAFLINTARGSLIDEKALYDALSSDSIKGAAIDVYHEEPYYGELCRLSNVILTPHVASGARESRAVMEMESVENLLKGLGISNDSNDYI